MADERFTCLNYVTFREPSFEERPERRKMGTGMEARKARGTVALDGDERWTAELAVGLLAMGGHDGVKNRRDPGPASAPPAVP